MNAGKSPIILVADADTLMRWAIGQSLSAEGYVVWEASEPTVAVRRLESSPDAVIVDAGLLLEAADSSLVSALIAFSHGHPVILTTSDTVSSDVAIDAVHVLEKPFSLDALQTYLTKSLR